MAFCPPIRCLRRKVISHTHTHTHLLWRVHSLQELMRCLRISRVAKRSFSWVVSNFCKRNATTLFEFPLAIYDKSMINQRTYQPAYICTRPNSLITAKQRKISLWFLTVTGLLSMTGKQAWRQIPFITKDYEREFNSHVDAAWPSNCPARFGMNHTFSCRLHPPPCTGTAQ